MSGGGSSSGSAGSALAATTADPPIRNHLRVSSTMGEISIRYAESDDDIIAVHGFLCIVAGPSLPGVIDPKDSAMEVYRCAKHEAVIMAGKDGQLLGTIGIMQAPYWWNTKLRFLTNRWAFVVPGSGAWRPLLKEAKAIARSSNMEFHLISEERGKISIFNRSKVRDLPMGLKDKPLPVVQVPPLAKSPNSSRALMQ
jgi:hypothetical protein